MASEEQIVSLEEARKLVVRCMEACGTDKAHADVLAELLVTADYRGHYSHGLNRLDVYPKEVQMGVVCGGGKEPVIIKETVATAFVDGQNLLGPVVGKFAIDLAVKKAKEAGVGVVTAKGSNHYGIAGWYSIRAAEQGLLGLSCTNTSPIVIPTRSKTCALGTNPITLAAPGKDGDMFVLDMATSSVAWGKVEIQARKCKELPKGWAVDSDGKETLDPSKVMGLLPLGGLEENGGYKGYGLSLLVETITGILAGSPFGPYIRKWKNYESEANLAQFFIVIDPNAFEDGFTERMSDLMTHCRNLEPANGEFPVLVAGDPEREHMTLCDRLGGIPYHPNQMKFLNDLAAELKVKPVETLTKS